MAGEILLHLRARRNPRIGLAARKALLTIALLTIGVVAVLPKMGIPREPVTVWGILGLAALEAGLAFALPEVIEKQAAGVDYRFFHDRIEMAAAGGFVFSLPYDNIAAVEEPETPDWEHGLTTVRVTTHRPVAPSFFGIGTTVHLSSLDRSDNPHARIKEVVEKCRQA